MGNGSLHSLNFRESPEGVKKTCRKARPGTDVDDFDTREAVEHAGLEDIRPSSEEIDAIVRSIVKPQQSREVYIPMFDLDRSNRTKTEPG